MIWKKLEIFCMSYFFINTQLYNKFQRYLRHVTFHQLPEPYMDRYLIGYIWEIYEHDKPTKWPLCPVNTYM